MMLKLQNVVPLGVLQNSSSNFTLTEFDNSSDDDDSER